MWNVWMHYLRNSTYWIQNSCYLARTIEPLLWLVGAAILILAILFIVVKCSSYQRQLESATVTAFGSTESDITRVPNTNMHSVEGSNPVWMQAYGNEWYKDDTLSQTSERGSLDENAVVIGNNQEDNTGNSSCNSQSNMLRSNAL